MRWIRSTLRAGCLLFLASAIAGCEFFGGAAVGAAGTSTAYEVQNKKALNELEEEFAEGKIDRDEYLRRKDEIEDRSLVY